MTLKKIGRSVLLPILQCVKTHRSMTNLACVWSLCIRLRGKSYSLVGCLPQGLGAQILYMSYEILYYFLE